MTNIFLLFFFFLFSGKGTGLGGLTNSQSVSFRQGTNVEFGGSAFPPNGPSQRGVCTEQYLFKILYIDLMVVKHHNLKSPISLFC